MIWQRIVVATGAAVGDPGPLPADIEGLAPESLADLSWVVDKSLGYDGVGYVPAARTCSVFELMYLRCSQAERIKIRGSKDARVIDYLQALTVIKGVDLDSVLTIAALVQFESLDLLAPGRADQIRNGTPPPTA